MVARDALCVEKGHNAVDQSVVGMNVLTRTWNPINAVHGGVKNNVVGTGGSIGIIGSEIKPYGDD